MKKVYVKPPPAAQYLNNGVFRINNGHNIFWNLDRELLSKGIIVKTLDKDKKNDGDLYIYSDAPFPWEIGIWKKIITIQDRNILFCFESPIVNPFSHLMLVHNLFKKVYTWDDTLVDNKKYFKFFIPQLPAGLNIKPINFKRRKLITFINAKKDVPFILQLLSPYKKNLYKERVRAIEYFTNKINEEFDFYGRGWDRPIPWSLRERLFGIVKYGSYRGEIKDNKLKTLTQYKFCLCFENAVAPGYITEKIFDCFKARCIPLYLGAPDIEKYVAKKCFINVSKFSSYEKLLNYIQNIDENSFNKYIKNIEIFLSDRKVRANWFEKPFHKKILAEFK